MRYICPVCGHLMSDDALPNYCPICHCPSDDFVAEEES